MISASLPLTSQPPNLYYGKEEKEENGSTAHVKGCVPESFGDFGRRLGGWDNMLQ